jgi:hypothetical protein
MMKAIASCGDDAVCLITTLAEQGADAFVGREPIVLLERFVLIVCLHLYACPHPLVEEVHNYQVFGVRSKESKERV